MSHRNGKVSKTVRNEDINMMTKCREKLVRCNVRFVPRMKINFISIGKLDGEGCNCEFGNCRQVRIPGSGCWSQRFRTIHMLV